MNRYLALNQLDYIFASRVLSTLMVSRIGSTERGVCKILF